MVGDRFRPPDAGVAGATLSPMAAPDLTGSVALVTGAANGIGAAVATRLASLGATIVAADVDEAAGTALAESVGGTFVRCDVSDPAQSEAAVAVAVDTHGGLDLAFLNAGISTGCGMAENFDLATYRRAMSINLDGVVFGVNAVVPALRARGGGRIVATASMAGLTAVPMDPIYAANKHAVIGLVRSLAGLYAEEGIVVNALCPSFARTAIIDPIAASLEDVGFPILEVSEVVDTFVQLLDEGATGDCWFVVPGRDSAPFGFRNVPGPR